MRTSPATVKGWFVVFGVMVAVGCWCGAAAGGLLASTPLALPGWQGSNSVDEDDGFGGLFGDEERAVVDYAVFAPGAFQAFMAAHSFTPVAAPPSDLVIYAYQILDVEAASPGIELFSVGLEADDIRGFGPSEAFQGGESPSDYGGTDNGHSMIWTWGGVNSLIGVGDSSGILFFGSPNLPEWATMQLTSGVSTTNPDPPAPSVSDEPFIIIPEPSSVLLLLIGIGLWKRLLGRRVG